MSSTFQNRNNNQNNTDYFDSDKRNHNEINNPNIDSKEANLSTKGQNTLEQENLSTTNQVEKIRELINKLCDCLSSLSDFKDNSSSKDIGEIVKKLNEKKDFGIVNLLSNEKVFQALKKGVRRCFAYGHFNNIQEDFINIVKNYSELFPRKKLYEKVLLPPAKEKLVLDSTFCYLEGISKIINFLDVNDENHKYSEVISKILLQATQKGLYECLNKKNLPEVNKLIQFLNEKYNIKSHDLFIYNQSKLIRECICKTLSNGEINDVFGKQDLSSNKILECAKDGLRYVILHAEFLNAEKYFQFIFRNERKSNFQFLFKNIGTFSKEHFFSDYKIMKGSQDKLSELLLCFKTDDAENFIKFIEQNFGKENLQYLLSENIFNASLCTLSSSIKNRRPNDQEKLIKFLDKYFPDRKVPNENLKLKEKNKYLVLYSLQMAYEEGVKIYKHNDTNKLIMKNFSLIY